MAAVNLNSLSAQALRNVFESVDSVLCDNDGVLTFFGSLMPGASECITKFRECGKHVKIVTNNATFGRNLISELFRKQGLQCPREDIITPTCAITDYLQKINFAGKVWLLGCEPMVAEFREKGFTILDSEDQQVTNVTEIPQRLLHFDPAVKAIVVDLCLNTTFGTMVKAIEYLKQDPEILLIFGLTDKTLPIARNKVVTGVAHIQHMIAELSNRQPVILCKPSEDFGKYLIDALNCEPSRTLFIGDSLESDIGFAKSLGFKQLLVLTGTTKLEDLRTCNDTFRPDYYISSLDELNSLLKPDILS